MNVLLLCLRGRLLFELLQYIAGKARHGIMRVVRALGKEIRRIRTTDLGE